MPHTWVIIHLYLLALIKEPDDPEFSEVGFGDNSLNSFGFEIDEHPFIHLLITCGNFLWCGCLLSLTIDALVK